MEIVSYAVPDPNAKAHRRQAVIRLALQTAHRCAAAALLLTLAAWALAYEHQDFHWPLAIAFAAADIGFCAALLALTISRRARLRGGEAFGVFLFNLIFLILSLQMMLFSRLDVIRTMLEQFFSPPPG